MVREKYFSRFVPKIFSMRVDEDLLRRFIAVCTTTETLRR